MSKRLVRIQSISYNEDTVGECEVSFFSTDQGGGTQHTVTICNRCRLCTVDTTSTDMGRRTITSDQSVEQLEKPTWSLR